MARAISYDPSEGEFVDFETLDDWRERDEKKNARIAHLEARIAAADAAVEALEPFAEAADESDEWPLDDENQAPVDVGQCRAARTALAAYLASKEPSE